MRNNKRGTYDLLSIKTLSTMFKKFSVGALALGLVLLGGSTVYAFGPGGFSMDAFSSFTSEQQAAIEQSHTIMEEAREKADQALENAGVDREAMHEAMQAFHQAHMSAIKDALEAKDYDAFKEAVRDAPFAEEITEEVFMKLTELRELHESGDREAAQELRQELIEDGIKGPLFGKEHGLRGFRHGMMGE